ncbi:MAG TPA: LysR substrate-binding domain-containing protein [Acetobacteraceae bacterium]|jgi:LysR family nitrogen assimilation transcriptional regulator|nr:LysR substrate-binding domain-containing protein [Acetobacteraceae bacterium]
MQLVISGGHDIAPVPAGSRRRFPGTPTQPSASHQDQPPETISLGIAAEVGEAIVAFLANAFQLRWPNSRLVIREGRGSTLDEWVTDRSVDVAILDEGSKHPELQLIPILRDKLGLVASVHSEMGGERRPLPFRELGRLPLILPHEKHWFRRRLDRIALQCGVQLSLALQVDGISMITSLVRKDVGFSILPRAAVQTEIACGDLAFRRITQPSLSSNSSIAFHRSAAGTHVATFAEMIRLAIATYAREGAWPRVKVATMY